MKKIIFSVIFLFACLGFATAQTTPEKTTAKTSSTGGKMQSKMIKRSDREASTKTTRLKKDGTPDMRVKENKLSAKDSSHAGPLKKDGTADMRYKANKKK